MEEFIFTVVMDLLGTKYMLYFEMLANISKMKQSQLVKHLRTNHAELEGKSRSYCRYIIRHTMLTPESKTHIFVLPAIAKIAKITCIKFVNTVKRC